MAAVTPMAGAPRTAKVRMALATVDESRAIKIARPGWESFLWSRKPHPVFLPFNRF